MRVLQNKILFCNTKKKKDHSQGFIQKKEKEKKEVITDSHLLDDCR